MARAGEVEESPVEPRTPLASRASVLHVLVLALATLIVWWPRWHGPIDLRYDGAVYYELGTSLAQGRGYRLLNEPGEARALQYPPLLPAWIALHQRVLGSSDVRVVGPALRHSMAFVALAYALATYALARRHVPGAWACAASLLVSLSFYTVFLSDLCFTEVPFALVTVGFFLAQGARARGPRAILSPLLAAGAFFLRTAGVALLGSWALESVLRRQWRVAALRALVALACVISWQTYVASVRASPEYEHAAYPYQRAPYQYYNVSYAENLSLRDPFRPEAGQLERAALLQRLGTNLAPLGLALGETVSAPGGYWRWPWERWFKPLGLAVHSLAGILPTLALALLVAFGLVRLARGGERGLVLYVLASLALILPLPWPVQIPRYVAPLAPFLALALMVGLRTLLARRAALVVGGVLGVQAFTARQLFAHSHLSYSIPPASADAEPTPARAFLFEDARDWRAFYASLDWLARNTPADARVASSCPHLVHLVTGRTAVMPPFEADPREAQRLLDAVPIEYLLVDRFRFLDVAEHYLVPVIADESLWEPVHREAEVLTIYRRR
jgi:hypothetical protein